MLDKGQKILTHIIAICMVSIKLTTVSGTKNKYRDFLIISSSGIAIVILEFLYINQSNIQYITIIIMVCQLFKKLDNHEFFIQKYFASGSVFRYFINIFID